MMLRKVIGAGLVLFVVLSFLSGTLLAQQNPFFTDKKAASKPQSRQMVPPHPVLIKLAVWQQRLNDAMAELMVQVHQENRPGPLIYLLLIAFFYGALHAAGPGHGKALATSFLMSQQASLGRCLLLGNGVALAHGLSGILLILTMHFIMKSGVIGPLQSTTSVTQYISYSLVTLLGLTLVIKSLSRIWTSAKTGEAATENADRKNGIHMLPVAVAVGMVPCPGVVMVMLLAMSMDMITLGVVLGICIAMGMAVTITFVVILFIYAKEMAIKAMSGYHKWARRVAFGIELIAGFMVTVLGGLLLFATIYA